MLEFREPLFLLLVVLSPVLFWALSRPSGRIVF